jgi:hypothetical protein
MTGERAKNDPGAIGVHFRYVGRSRSLKRHGGTPEIQIEPNP